MHDAAARRPPSVDALARTVEGSGLPHPLRVDAARAAIAAGEPEQVARHAADRARSRLQPVVNATGVLLHTNLGRAPVAHHHEPRPSNLELDLATGERAARRSDVGDLLARACGAADALVVNNGAAAVLLALAALGAGRGVAVSRGELVEIGGGFRIPEVLEQSGACLVEVGTTNRTRLADYEQVLGGDVAVLLKVHQSNYRIVGFTEEAPVPALASLGASHGVPLVVDVGSGLLDEACPWLPAGPPAWLVGEPGVRQTLTAGAGLVTFSGDKLLGGPQAGVLAGDRHLVRRCAAHPLARALRPGGLVLAALAETTLAYLDRDGEAIPFWRAATTPVDDLARRAAALDPGRGVERVELASVTGGGTLPGATIPSVGLAISGDHRPALRGADPPIIARVEDGRTVCDLRTVEPDRDEHLGSTLRALPR